MLARSWVPGTSPDLILEWKSQIAGTRASTATMTTGETIGGPRIAPTKDVGAWPIEETAKPRSTQTVVPARRLTAGISRMRRMFCKSCSVSSLINQRPKICA